MQIDSTMTAYRANSFFCPLFIFSGAVSFLVSVCFLFFFIHCILYGENYPLIVFEVFRYFLQIFHALSQTI